MAKFIDIDNDNAIIDFNNMTFKQFRYLVAQANRKNKEETDKTELEFFEKNYDGNDF